MYIYIEKEDPHLKPKKILAFLTVIGIIIAALNFGLIINQKPSEPIVAPFSISELVTVQDNSLLPISNISLPPTKVKKIKMVITAYSSTPWETDDTPYITASGKKVKNGIVANNLLPFGTEVKIPEIYGDKIFVVEDRMSWKKSYYHLDIWFPEYQKAKEFGKKITYVEILEN